MLIHFIKFPKSFLFLLCLMLFTTGIRAQGGKKGASPQIAGKTAVATIAPNKTFELPAHYFGYNAQMLRGPAWQEPGFITQVEKLQPQLIRFPGGTVSSYWDWRNGWLKEGIDLKFDWAKIKKNSLKLEDLSFACKQTGAYPLFVLNMITSTLEEQLEMLRYAYGLGLPVKFVELDNEVYLGDPFYVDRFKTGVEYGKEANNWIAAIKKEFPGVKVSVVGHSARVSAGKSQKKNFVRTDLWNRDVLSVIKNADAMSFHVYGGNGLNFSAKSLVSDVEDEETGDAAKVQAVFDQPSSIPVVLGIPFQRWKNTEAYDYQLLPSGMKVWASEYNLFEREGVMAGTWAHGLYSATQTLLYFENNKTELACYHNLTTSAQFAAIFNNTNGFAKAVKKKENSAYDFTASGYTLSYFGRLISGGGTVMKLKFSYNPQISGLRGQNYPGLYSWMVNGSKGKKIMVVNLSDENIITDFGKLLKGSVAFEQYISTPHTQVASSNDVIQKSGKATSVVLAPYSVTIIEGE